jgi:TonB family protein
VDLDYLNSAYHRTNRTNFNSLGYILSFLIHIFLLATLLAGKFHNWSNKKLEVYSLTVIPGSKLGGVSQVEDKPEELKQQQEPQKNVQLAPKKEVPLTAPPQKIRNKSLLPKVTSPTPTPTPLALATVTPTMPATVSQALPTFTYIPTLKVTSTKIQIPPTSTSLPPTKVITLTSKPTLPPTSTPVKKSLYELRNKDLKVTNSSSKSIDNEYNKKMKEYLGESNNVGGQGLGAAKVGGFGTGGGVVKPKEFFQYLETIQREVKSNWRWFDSSGRLKVQVELRISQRGEIESARISEPSVSAEFDRSVMRALEAANPLPAPPSNVYKDFKQVIILFDSEQ